LQWLGGYLINVVDPTIWFGELIHRIQAEPGLDIATVSGLRYPAEAACIRQVSGYVVQIRRAGFNEADKQDLTERKRDHIQPDAVVLNDGTLVQLRATAELIIKDLEARRSIMGKIYRASTASTTSS